MRSLRVRPRLPASPGNRSGLHGKSAAPDFCAAVNPALGVGHGGWPVAPQENRAVEVDDVAELPQYEARRHGQAGADHVAHHHTQSELTGLAGHGKSFGQAAAFVELDVDNVESSPKPGQI